MTAPASRAGRRGDARRAVLAAAAFAAALIAIALSPALAWGAPIRLWHGYRGDEERVLEELVAAWSKQKGEAVELLAVPYDAFGSKLAAAIPLGEGPDLFIDAHERLGDYRGRGLVAPVGDALAEPAEFVPAALAAVRLDGVEFGVPIGQKCLALFVNESFGVAAPEHLEDFIGLRASLPPDVVPLAYEAPSVYAHAAVLGAFGGELLAPGDKFGFVGEAAERSVELVRELIARGAVPEEVDGALVTNLFRSGKAAFAVSGPWLVADLEKTAFRYSVAPLPKVEATGEPMRPLLTVEAVMLSPEGAGRAAVRDLAKALGSRAAAEARARRTRTLPAREGASVADDAILAAFARQARVAVPMPTAPAMRAVWVPAQRGLRKALRGDASAAVALREAERRFDDVQRPLPPRRSPVPMAVGLGALALFGAFALLRRSREEPLTVALKKSLPIYRYVAHAVIAVGVLVIAPLVVGAGIAFSAGPRNDMHYVGAANFVSILTARGGDLFANGSFYLVLVVTLLWTIVNLTFHLGLGVSVALLLNRPALRMRAAYRVLLIIPWAVPSYVTALAWKGMFHRQFGAVTGLLTAMNDAFGTHLEPIAWFARFSTAFAANAATNIWLGFPFMMVVTLGALTGVPDDVLEAARVDGASRWQRLTKVTLPIIRPTLAPAVTLGAIWTFNQFNVIYLVSGGDPDGTTDILVVDAYRWAFTRESQFGYAAAYALIIFGMLYGATRLAAWRRERALA